MSSKTHITNHFKIETKIARLPSILRRIMYVTYSIPDVEMNMTGSICTASSIIYLYLVLDIPLDRDYIGRYKLILGKLFAAIRITNPIAVIILYNSQLEC